MNSTCCREILALCCGMARCISCGSDVRTRHPLIWLLFSEVVFIDGTSRVQRLLQFLRIVDAPSEHKSTMPGCVGVCCCGEPGATPGLELIISTALSMKVEEHSKASRYEWDDFCLFGIGIGIGIRCYQMLVTRENREREFPLMPEASVLPRVESQPCQNSGVFLEIVV